MRRLINTFLELVGYVVVTGVILTGLLFLLADVFPDLEGPTSGQLTVTSSGATRQAVANRTVEALLLETAVGEILATSVSETQSVKETQRWLAGATATRARQSAQAIRELTATSIPTVTNTPMKTPTATVTNTRPPTQIPTLTSTLTPTFARIRTPALTPTDTPTKTLTPTHTPTSTPTDTPTNTPTPTSTPPPTPTRTPRPTADPDAGTYHVNRPGGVNVRSCAGTSCSVVTQYRFGRTVRVVRFETGQPVGADARWARMSDGNFVHASLLTRGSPPVTQRPPDRPGPRTAPL